MIHSICLILFQISYAQTEDGNQIIVTYCMTYLNSHNSLVHNNLAYTYVYLVTDTSNIKKRELVQSKPHTIKQLLVYPSHTSWNAVAR